MSATKVNPFTSLEQLNYWWLNQKVKCENWVPYTFTEEDYKNINIIFDIFINNKAQDMYKSSTKYNMNIYIYIILEFSTYENECKLCSKYSLNLFSKYFPNIQEYAFENKQLYYCYLFNKYRNKDEYLDELEIFTTTEYPQSLFLMAKHYENKSDTTNNSLYNTYLNKAIELNCSEAVLHKINNTTNKDEKEKYELKYIEILYNEERYFEIANYYQKTNPKKFVYYLSLSVERYNDYLSLGELIKYYRDINTKDYVKYLEILCNNYISNEYLKELASFYYNNCYLNKLIETYKKLIQCGEYNYYYILAILYDNELDSTKNYMKYMKKAIEHNVKNSREHFIDYVKLNNINDMTTTMYICNNF